MSQYWPKPSTRRVTRWQKFLSDRHVGPISSPTHRRMWVWLRRCHDKCVPGSKFVVGKQSPNSAVFFSRFWHGRSLAEPGENALWARVSEKLLVNNNANDAKRENCEDLWWQPYNQFWTVFSAIHWLAMFIPKSYTFCFGARILWIDWQT